MRFAQNANTSPGSDSRIGKRYAYFNPRAPIRDLRECADLMAITYNQAQYLERIAFIKIRAALSAWGYNKETP